MSVYSDLIIRYNLEEVDPLFVVDSGVHTTMTSRICKILSTIDQDSKFIALQLKDEYLAVSGCNSIEAKVLLKINKETNEPIDIVDTSKANHEIYRTTSILKNELEDNSKFIYEVYTIPGYFNTHF